MFFSDIPKIWLRAYLFICLWYAINFAVSVTSEYLIFEPFNHTLYTGVYLYITLCLAVIVIWLWSNFLFRFRIILQVIGHVFGVVASFVIFGTVKYYADYYLDQFIYFDDYVEYMTQLLSWDAFQFNNQYLTAVFIYYIIRYVESLKRKEQEKTELEVKNKEMQLSLLKSQINPHFLFNALNSISTLMATSKEKARQMITQLSDIFRYALDSYGDQKVPLDKEMDFINNYIRIQQVRFRERLEFKTEISPDCRGLLIPPMVLQALVENSVKHGIGPKDTGGTITLRVTKNTNFAKFEVQDNGLGSNAQAVLDGKTSTGIGLKNSDQRLRSMYGDNSALNVQSTEEGFTVSFIVPIEKN